MNKIVASLLVAAAVSFTACDKDDPPLPDNMVQFEAAEQGLDAATSEVTVKVKLSRITDVAIPISVELTENGVVYGTKYSTTPAVVSGKLSLTIPAGGNETSFKVTKVADILLNGDEFIEFTVKSAANPVLIGQTAKLKLKFSSIISTGTTMELNGGAGGSNAANSVYVDFSNNTQTSVVRKNWDMGFHGGSPYRVIINNVTAAAVIATNKTDITTVTETDVNKASLAIGFGKGILALIDDIKGDLTKTAIAEIAANDADNKVYVISRAGANGAAPLTTDLKKVRILRTATGYTLQHADINSPTFNTITINKDAAYNFKFVSFETGAVEVEPKKERWDIQWTWSVFETANPSTEPGAPPIIPYAFSDLVFSNRLGGVQVAEVLTSTVTYANYAESNIAGTSFTSDRDGIGAKWRITLPASLLTDRFYVIKDAAGNVYKLKFLNFHSTAVDGGKRGYPNIEYKLVKKGA